MPWGINRAASQTGTWPPLCMLDRRSCGCELWKNERSWPWKVQRQSFLHCRPPLLFSLSSLPARQAHLTFTQFPPFPLPASPICPHISYQSLQKISLSFFSLFSACVFLAAGDLQVNWSTALEAKNLTRKALSFPLLTATMWGVYHGNTNRMTSEKIMLKGSGYSLSCWFSGV